MSNLDPKTAEYTASLPEVDTCRLPLGTLFWAEGRLFQVVETGASGYHRAREWRKSESTDVALTPGSFLARYLPLVKRGRLLPVYRSRVELTEHNQTTCYVFPVENLALDAAYLDVALVQSSGAFVRNHSNEPAFAATDGVHIFRLYYYRRSVHGRSTDLSALQARPLPFSPRPHTEGPGYWRLLSSWVESVPAPDMTQQTPPVRLASHSDDTIPMRPIQPSES